MDNDRAYIKARAKKRLLHSSDMGTRRKKKKRKTKDYLGRTVEKERKEAGWELWNKGRTIAANREKWKHSVEALCGGTKRIGEA